MIRATTCPDTALELLRSGMWPVAIKTGGKAPIGNSWGSTRPTEQSLCETFQSCPEAGVGLLLGPEGGIIDIECDGPEGQDSLTKLMGGQIVPTFGWSSARGPHHLFRYDPRLARYGKSILKLPDLPGLEIRIGGNRKQLQSNCPPTVGADGKPREWNGNDEVANLPEAVFSFLDTALASPKREVSPHPSRGLTPDTAFAVNSACSAYTTAALDDECQAVALAPDGEQNSTLNKAAFALGQLVGTGALDRSVVERRLLEAAADYVQKDGEAQARATIRSGLDAGQNEPRDLSHLDANRHGRPDPVNGQSAASPRSVVDGKAQGAKRRGRRYVTLGRPWSEKGIGELPDDDEPSESDDCEEPGSNGKPQNSMGKSRSESQVQVLLNLARDIRLFHSAEMRPYAKVFVPKREEPPVTEHHQVLGVRSQAFKSWLLVAFLRLTGSAPPSEALTSAIRTLEAKACHEGREEAVFLRVGNAGDHHYVDLCDYAWRVVEISGGGWRVLDESPVAFRRTSGMLSLPTPVPGGSLSLLRPYVNVAGDDDFKLLVAWLVTCLRPIGPYPVMMFQGEQGSAKSTTSRVLRSLIDPHSTPLRSEPKSARDLMVTANASWLIALDNLSAVWPWLSDALCRLATGGGFATRALYSDEDETHFNAMRPILLNGIDDVAERPDLLDRAILLRLPTIPENQRQEESKFWSKFEAERPQIFGALIDVFAQALKVLPDVHLDRLPRMADFARFGEAVSRSQGWGDGAFLRAYRKNIEGVTESAAEASPVATAILKLMTERIEDEWQGTSGELLAALTGQINEREAKAKGWPQTPRKLSNELIRLAPVLRRLGIAYTRLESRTNKGRKVILSKALPPAVGDEPSQQSPLTPGLENKGISSDGSRNDASATTATVTGSPMHSHSDNPLIYRDLQHSGDGRDGRDAESRDIPTRQDLADSNAVEERRAIQDEEVEYF
ncbi:MAG: bifunctional DNA primase/polymerase [Isosphaeraceae bacterium]